MQVLHVTKFYHPKVGGLEWVAHELAKSCVRRGDAVRAVGTVERGWGKRARYDGVSTVKASSLGVATSVPVAPTFPLHVWRAKRSADLIHFHLPDPISVTSELLTGRTDAVRVATFHGDISRGTHRRVLPAYRPVLDRFLDRVDEIFVGSPRQRDSSPLLESHREKCTVVPLGIDLDEWGSYGGPDYELPGDPDRPTLLFVGRLVYFKGAEYAIDAMASVDADLLVVGTGDRKRDLHERTRERGVEGQVHFLGRVPDEILHYCYDAADVFVFPSVASAESFGLVQLEAMACGTPVVNTNVDSGVPWVSEDGETGLTVPPGDADALAEALNRLLGDDRYRERLGRAARERVRDRFTRERMVEEYLRRYDALVAGES